MYDFITEKVARPLDNWIDDLSRKVDELEESNKKCRSTMEKNDNEIRDLNMKMYMIRNCIEGYKSYIFS